jgi:hypothetical protein
VRTRQRPSLLQVKVIICWSWIPDCCVVGNLRNLTEKASTRIRLIREKTLPISAWYLNASHECARFARSKYSVPIASGYMGQGNLTVLQLISARSRGSAWKPHLDGFFNADDHISELEVILVVCRGVAFTPEVQILAC